MKRKHWPNYISREGSKFESRKAFTEASSIVTTTDSKVETAGVPLTRIADKTFACSRPELHTFVIGDSGCGKTRRVILPAIKLIAKSGESMVIADPKGELYRKTGKALEAKGYKVKIINFRNPSLGCRWNPLQEIERLYRSMSQEDQDKAVLMLKDIVDIMKGDVESEKDAYWENVASKYIMGVAYLILEHGEEGDLTFENIAILVDEINKYVGDNKVSNRTSQKFSEYYYALPGNSLIRQNLSAFAEASERTKSSIFTVTQTMVSAFTNQESLMDMFYQSDFSCDEIGKEKTALYIILPDNSTALYGVATLLVNQIYSALVEFADLQPGGVLPNKTVFILDEFANFAKIPSVDTMLTAARSRGMRFILVCQSMEQLHGKYGSNGAEVLLSNCRIWLYMSSRNYQFLKRLEDLCGDYLSPYTGEKLPLISVSDLQHLPMGTVLALNDRCYPMMGYLPDYSEYDFGADKTDEHGELPEPRDYIKRNFKSVKEFIANTHTVSKKKAARYSAPAARVTGEAAASDQADVSDLLNKMNAFLGKPVASAAVNATAAPESAASDTASSQDVNPSSSIWDDEGWT